MNDYWIALLKGLTLDSQADLSVWWKIPLVILFIFLILFLAGSVQ